MQQSEYVRMAQRETSYWWHLGRIKIIRTYLQQNTTGGRDINILNVGCGTGGTVPLLEEFGSVENVDMAQQALDFMRSRGYTKVKLIDGKKLPYKDHAFDLVVAFDVLEHIENDSAALKEWSRVLKPSGRIIVTVPAYQWLWSEHDVSLHHKRRYTKRSLKDVATRSGLNTARSSYAVVVFLPVITAVRFLKKFSKNSPQANQETSYVNLPSWLNSLFTSMLGAEARMHKYVTFPAGTSVIAALSKSEKRIQ